MSVGNQNSIITPAKGKFDNTGHRHVYKIRNSMNYPPLKRIHKQKNEKKECRICEENDQCIELLESRLNELDFTADKLSDILSVDEINEPFVAAIPTPANSIDFSRLDLDDLFKIASQMQPGRGESPPPSPQLSSLEHQQKQQFLQQQQIVLPQLQQQQLPLSCHQLTEITSYYYPSII